MARLNISPRAAADLSTIADRIMLDNPSAADRWVDAISVVFELLARHPYIGERFHTERHRALRRYVMRNYVIYYVPAEDGVDIARVIHGARQHEQMLDDDSI
jgi:toxin ParE1/3/4